MDDTDPDIIFDENGFCNHCIEYFKKEKKLMFNNAGKKEELEVLVKKNQEERKGEEI